MRFLRCFTFALVVLLCVPPMQTQSIQAEPRVKTVELTFTTIDVPGATNTNIYGINIAEDMVGSYEEVVGTPSRGFLLAKGNFTLFEYPNASDTAAFGINDSSLISGWAVKGDSVAVGFLYDGTTFHTIRAPGKSATFVRGINNAGVLVGGDGSFGASRGFALAGRRFKDVSPPGSYVFIIADGVNNIRQIVGTADDQGFLYSGGKFKTISVPGATMTLPLGINDSGIIVGWYLKGPPFFPRGFVLKGGKYMSLNYPGATGTFAAGVNNAGKIVGSYTLDGVVLHGFVTSPITVADVK